MFNDLTSSDFDDRFFQAAHKPQPLAKDNEKILMMCDDVAVHGIDWK